ncbi:MAG: hypothetical protein AB1540_03330 [Bdellovibrionota bacterium]
MRFEISGQGSRSKATSHGGSSLALGFCLILVLLIFGCSSYTSTTRSARDEFYSGKYTDAAKRLEKGAHEDGVDQLLYLFDRATALHHAGEYEESNKDFHLADKLAEIKDYTSLATEVATLVTNDKIIPYKGEDFEKTLIPQYLALNYLMLGKHEDALVECRRVNHKLHLMITQGQRKYQLNPMASYLAAILYEDNREWDHAYIDYQAVKKLLPELSYLREDLYRLAWRNKIREDMQRWAEEFGLSAEEQKRIRDTANKPEIIVIIENGRSPEKQPHPTWTALPRYVPRYNPVSQLEVTVNQETLGLSQTLFDVEKTAIQNLDDKFAGILAKKVGGVVAKEVVAHQIGKRTDPIIGALAWLGMHAVNQADLRSWLTLPKDFQIFRVRVEPAESYTIRIRPKSFDDREVASSSGVIEKIVRFDPSRKEKRIFVPVRVM